MLPETIVHFSRFLERRCASSGKTLACLPQFLEDSVEVFFGLIDTYGEIV